MYSMKIETASTQYSCVVGAGCIEQLPHHLPTTVSKILIITDQHVASLHLTTVRNVIAKLSIPSSEFILPVGEEAKSFVWFEQIITHAIEAGLDRSSVIIALGGGVVGDVAGFVASVYMRGIPYIQLPTTVLAHDSSIGGKVAINHPLGKNMVGVFYHPVAVLMDTQFLLTLDDRVYRSGFAEMIKHAIIYDAAFFAWLEQHTQSLLSKELSTLEEALYRSISIKAAIIKEDERDVNTRALLNYGHTIGHALENIYGYQILHGEAVTIGMNLAAKIAKKYLHSSIDLKQIQQLCEAFFLPIQPRERIEAQLLQSAILRDKKAVAGQLNMVFPDNIGSAFIYSNIRLEWIVDVLLEQ